MKVVTAAFLLLMLGLSLGCELSLFFNTGPTS
jgi:hypothetical protein